MGNRILAVILFASGILSLVRTFLGDTDGHPALYFAVAYLIWRLE